MSQHTPGPWRVEQDTTLIWGDCNPDDQSSYGMGYPIAECRNTPSASWARGPRKYEEAEANARLIAAAPDLLQALEKALEILRHNPEASQPPRYRNIQASAVIAAALAKAKASSSSPTEQEKGE